MATKTELIIIIVIVIIVAKKPAIQTIQCYQMLPNNGRERKMILAFILRNRNIMLFFVISVSLYPPFKVSQTVNTWLSQWALYADRYIADIQQKGLKWHGYRIVQLGVFLFEECQPEKNNIGVRNNFAHLSLPASPILEGNHF